MKNQKYFFAVWDHSPTVIFRGQTRQEIFTREDIDGYIRKLKNAPALTRMDFSKDYTSGINE
jgi:hypothetical protein